MSKIINNETIKKYKYIELGFENCEGFIIPIEFIKDIYLHLRLSIKRDILKVDILNYLLVLIILYKKVLMIFFLKE